MNQPVQDIVTTVVGDRRITYELTRLLGSGNWGRVWLARKTVDPVQSDRIGASGGTEVPLPREEELPEVAIKTVPAVLNHMSRLADEATVLFDFGKTAQPNSRIVRLLSGERPYEPRPRHPHIGAFIELEYLSGQTLQEWLESDWFTSDEFSRRDAAREAAFVARELLSALQELWNRPGEEIAHRDIKPQNVIRLDDRLRVIDFNVAKIDNPNTIVGTQKFFAPELLAPSSFGAVSYDARVDLFAVGIIVWEVLHRRPFDRVAETTGQQSECTLAWPPLVPGEDAALDELLHALLDGLIAPVERRLPHPSEALTLVDAIEAYLRPRPAAPAERPGDLDLIELIAEFRPSGEAAVVTDTDHVSDVESYIRARRQVGDPLEDWLTELAITAVKDPGSPPLLIMLSGNAGDGKSHLIHRLTRERLRDAGVMHGVRVNADATHAETPTTDHQAMLEDFFAPFAEGGVAKKPVSIVAMNTGMVVRFFESAVSTQDGVAKFGPLYQTVKKQLGLEGGDAQPLEGRRVEVINLDLRSMVARPDGILPSFAERMLMRLDPQDPSGLTAPLMARCETCPARSLCPVRFNLEALTSGERPDVRGVVLDYLSRAALDVEVHLSPRNLWGFWYRLITGGAERYAREEGDTGLCDVVVRKVATRDKVWLLSGHFYQVLFSGSAKRRLWTVLHALDPAYAPVAALDRLHTRMGVRPALDSERTTVEAQLGGAGGDVFGLALARLLNINHEALLAPADRRNAAIRRGVMMNAHLHAAARRDGSFHDYQETLEAYDVYCANGAGQRGGAALNQAQQTRLADLVRYVQTALTKAYGRDTGDDRFLLQVDQPNSRTDSRLLVEVQQKLAREYFSPIKVLRPNPQVEALANRRELLTHLGYSSDTITLDIGGKRLTIDPVLYSFLRRVCDGQQPSANDRSRFQALSMIGSSLGNAIASHDESRTMYVESPDGRMSKLAPGSFGGWDVTEVTS